MGSISKDELVGQVSNLLYGYSHVVVNGENVLLSSLPVEYLTVLKRRVQNFDKEFDRTLSFDEETGFIIKPEALPDFGFFVTGERMINRPTQSVGGTRDQVGGRIKHSEAHSSRAERSW